MIPGIVWGLLLAFPVFMIALFFLAHFMCSITEKRLHEIEERSSALTRPSTDNYELAQLPGAVTKLVDLLCELYLNQQTIPIFQRIIQRFMTLLTESASSTPVTGLKLETMDVSGTKISLFDVAYPYDGAPCEEASEKAMIMRLGAEISGPLTLKISGVLRLDSGAIHFANIPFSAELVLRLANATIAFCVDELEAPPISRASYFLLPLPVMRITLAAPPAPLDFDVAVNIGSSFTLTDKGLIGKTLRAIVNMALTQMVGVWANITPAPAVVPLGPVMTTSQWCEALETAERIKENARKLNDSHSDDVSSRAETEYSRISGDEALKQQTQINAKPLGQRSGGMEKKAQDSRRRVAAKGIVDRAHENDSPRKIQRLKTELRRASQQGISAKQGVVSSTA